MDRSIGKLFAQTFNNGKITNKTKLEEYIRNLGVFSKDIFEIFQLSSGVLLGENKKDRFFYIMDKNGGLYTYPKNL